MYTGATWTGLALGFQVEVSMSVGLLGARTAELTDVHSSFPHRG